MTTGRGAAALGLLLAVMPVQAASVSAQAALSPAPSPAAGAVRVSAFRITGTTVLQSDGLQALVSEGVGRELTLAQIEALAARVTAWYRERGWL